MHRTKRFPTAVRGLPILSMLLLAAPSAARADLPARADLAAADSGPVTASANLARKADGAVFRAEPSSYPDASIAAVSNKVYQLSSFAEAAPAEQPPGQRYATTPAPTRFTTPAPTQFVAPAATPASAPAAAPATAPYASPATAPYASPATAPAATPYATPYAVPSAPPTAVPMMAPYATQAPTAAAPAWPAEQATASNFAGFQPQPILEPAPSVGQPPASTTPWLAAPPPPGAGAAGVTPLVPDNPQQPVTPPAPNSFIAALQKPWSIFAKKPPKPAVDPPAVRQEEPAASAAVVQGAPMPLGLEGYCPVTVLERGTWVEGRPQWGVRHRGRTYLFAGLEQQRAFLADPDRYAPALSGDDPVLAFEKGRCEPGRRAFGVTYQSRMYLFASPETRATFTADPDRYTVRVMIAEGGSPATVARRF